MRTIQLKEKKTFCNEFLSKSTKLRGELYYHDETNELEAERERRNATGEEEELQHEHKERKEMRGKGEKRMWLTSSQPRTKSEIKPFFCSRQCHFLPPLPTPLQVILLLLPSTNSLLILVLLVVARQTP